jgi:hypothetical protein
MGVFAGGVAHAAPLLEDLDPAKQAEVRAGKQVVVLQEVKGQAWPRVSIYRTIQAKPEEVAAVFFDYNQAFTYIPKIFKSEISKRHSSCVVEVDYGLDVPILPDEFYTVENRLSRLPGGGYLIAWKLLRAVQTKSSVGEFRIEPDGDTSIIRYQILTTPSSGMAGLLRGKAIDMIKDTVIAVAEETEKRKAEDPAGLKKQVESLQSALDSEP